MDSNTDKKWKDALLRSSLPLENMVAELLSKKNFESNGQFSYLRKNEHNISTEFSVDLEAFTLIGLGKGRYGATLNLLLECKYSHPTVKWVFSPVPFGNYLIGYINYFEELCTKRIVKSDPLYDFENGLIYCTRGIALHEKDVDEKSIEHGLSQLRFALPNLVEQMLSAQMSKLHDEDLNIAIICPVLVTTAPLYVLKPDLDFEAYQKSNCIEDVAEKVDSLVVHQSISPQLSKYIDEIIANLYKHYSLIDKRLSLLTKLIKGDSPFEVAFSKIRFEDHIKRAPERILIVNYYHLEKTIVELIKLIKKCTKNLHQVAQLKFNVTTREIDIKPLEK